MSIDVINNNEFRRYFKNTSWLFIGQSIRLLMGFFVSVAIARHLGPVAYGKINYVLSVVAILIVICELGLPQILNVELVDKPNEKDILLGTYQFLTLLTSSIVYVLLQCVIIIYDKENELMLYLLIGGLVFSPSLRSCELWFQSQVRAELSVKATTISLGVITGVKLFLIYHDYSLEWFAAATLLDVLMIAIIQMVYYKKSFGGIVLWRANHKLAYKWLRRSWPLLLSSLSIIVYVKIDLIILGILAGPESVGVYSVAINISSIAYIIPTLLASGVSPAVIRIRRTDRSLYLMKLQGYFDLFAICAYFLFIACNMSAAYLVDKLYGSDYIESVGVLILHSWSWLFVYLGVARRQYLILENLEYFTLLVTVTGALLNIFLNIVLIPMCGILGAALATVISQVVTSFITSFLNKQTVIIGVLQLKSILIFTRMPRLKRSITELFQ